MKSARSAIRTALFRLGLQSKAKDVVAALGEVGIRVSESLVRQVRIEIHKEQGKAAMRRMQRPAVNKRAYRPGRGKTPQRRQ